MSLVDVNLSRCVDCGATDRTVLLIFVAKALGKAKPFACCKRCAFKRGE